MNNIRNGTYGFRFDSSSHLQLPLCQLFAVGHDNVQSDSYRWNGLERTDGPLLLFQYTLSGTGTLYLNQQKHILNPNTAFLVDIPSDHHYTFNNEHGHWQFIFILIKPHTIMPLWNEIISQIGRLPHLSYESEPIQYLLQLYKAAQDGKITNPYTASQYVYSFFMFLKQYSEVSYIDEPIPVPIVSAKNWIDEHYVNMMGLELLAKQVGLSKYYFIRQFTHYIGFTPNAYVNRVRIKKSIELLFTTQHSLDYIAMEVGYSNASYFIKVFKKLIGQTPSHFRSHPQQLKYNKVFFD